MTVALPVPVLEIPISESPIMGAPSPFVGADDVEVLEERADVVSKVFSTYTHELMNISVSCRNPFEVTKRKQIRFNLTSAELSKDEVKLNFIPADTSYFSFLMGKQQYTSKVYGLIKAKPEDTAALLIYESIFFRVVGEEVAFRSVSSTARVLCEKIKLEDVKGMILDSKQAAAFSGLPKSEQDGIVGCYFESLSSVIFKVKSLSVRLI